MIQVSDICMQFDPREGPVLEGISFAVADGETMSVIGPSGCGKTTLLYILAGLTAPTSGTIAVGGRDAGADSGRISIILQDYGLFPWKTLAQNVGLGLKIQNRPPEVRRRVTEALLQELGLSGLERRYPTQLSGGQQQRVAIARALATDPDLLLMDEPFSSLDALTREHLQNTMLDMWQRKGLSYIIVTHSVEEAVFLGRSIVVLSDRPTRIKTVVANGGFGDRSFRMQDRYFDKIKQVRGALER